MLGFLKPYEVLISWEFFSSFSDYEGKYFSLHSDIDPSYSLRISYTDENKEKVKKILLEKIPLK